MFKWREMNTICLTYDELKALNDSGFSQEYQMKQGEYCRMIRENDNWNQLKP